MSVGFPNVNIARLCAIESRRWVKMLAIAKSLSLECMDMIWARIWNGTAFRLQGIPLSDLL